MSSTVVAVAGSTGNVGLPTTEALLAAGFTVIALTRTGSSSTSKLPKSDKLKTAEVDYTSVESLTSALKGAQVVVSALPTSVVGAQNPLIDASVAAGATRFIPSEFGSDTLDPFCAKLPVFGGKVATQKYIEEKAKSNPEFTYTYVINGAFFDWGLQHGFTLNPKEHKATVYDGGDVTFCATNLSTIGRGIVGVVKNLDATKNRAVYIQDTTTTQNKIVAATKKIDGKEWDITPVDSAQVEADSYAELKKEKPDFGKAMMGFIFKALFGKEEYGNYQAKSDNELLGIKELSDKEVEDIISKVLSS